MRRTRLLSTLSLIGVLALVVLIVLSSLEMSLADGMQSILSTRWGVTTLVDLYLGLFVFAGWIAYRERSAARAAPWILGLMLLGNFTTLVYLLFACLRANSVEDLLRPARA